MLLYPLLFHPIIKPKVWGTETWALSGYGEDVSVVSNGFLAGNSLSEVLEIYMDELVGGRVYERFGTEFPLLFKFIDAKDDLSIQVHPNDVQAAPLGMSGKAEMWYVTAASSEASLVMGFSRDTSEDEVRRRLDDDSIMDLLQVVRVQKGDVAHIPAGTVHALRRGTQVAEIQQSSDVTFRLYDYRRPGMDGKLRPLHINESLAVLDYKRLQNPLVTYDRQSKSPLLVRDEHFVTSLLRLDRPVRRDYAALDSFVVYMCTEGRVAVLCAESALDDIMLKKGATGSEDVMLKEGETVSSEVVLKAGETVLVPAALTEVRLSPLSQTAVLLEVTAG